MLVHELKTRPEPFEEIETGRKTFELRENDRGFEVGDLLVLREWSFYNSLVRPGTGYSGRKTCRRITYMLEGGSSPFGGSLAKGWVILALGDPYDDSWLDSALGSVRS